MIEENLFKIQQKIRETALACGRNPEDIQLVAVSKTVPIDRIGQAITAGQSVFGENYLQEAEEKIRQLRGRASFHFIGHLQSNKVKTVAELFDMVETVDRFKIAQALNKYLMASGKKIKILIQVNVGKEEQKSGVAVEQARELLQQTRSLSQVKTVGLMTLPPFTASLEETRQYFRELASLANTFAKEGLFYPGEKVEISMGMSNDFHIAIEEGATMVRVGTAIFGSRQ